jgi:ribosomal protein S18 acetylase RimI-like enzyme
MNEMHWSQMNCPLNSSLIERNEIESTFYISKKPPPDFILPSGITCSIYHPLCLDGQIGPTPDKEIKQQIMNFIRENDCTESGNITELSLESLERLLSTPSVMALLINNNNNNKIIGTMISPIFRANYRGSFEFLTSYTTFLCVDKEFRDKGLAMALIRAVMIEGYNRYGINHGYYMTFTSHHNINNEIKSWYRPINVKRAGEAGFTLQNFVKKGDRGSAATRQRLAYHVGKPKILPTKVSSESYDIILNILKTGDLYLTPTRQEFEWLCKCFDIYMVGTDSLFMLFPMTSLISSTGKRVRNAQLALMIGDVLSQALWIANENGYDLLYGWCGGDITSERVSNIRGLITVAKSYLELYNTQFSIPNNKMMVPIF